MKTKAKKERKRLKPSTSRLEAHRELQNERTIKDSSKESDASERLKMPFKRVFKIEFSERRGLVRAGDFAVFVWNMAIVFVVVTVFLCLLKLVSMLFSALFL